jgi:hypothetical protein
MLRAVSLLLLSSCTAPGQLDLDDGDVVRFSLGEDRFCVPRSRVVEAPSWVPQSSDIKDQGFAVAGCLWSTAGNLGECADLPSIGHFGVGIETSHAFTAYDNIPAAAFYRQITSEPDTEVSRVNGAENAELTNGRLSHLSFYWRFGSSDGRSRLRPSGSDELLFTCEARTDRYLCNRIFNADGKSYSYVFATTEPQFHDPSLLDAKVRSTLARLQCDAV